MRFFYENGLGDKGYFSETNLVKAIYTAWNIVADLYLLNNGLKKIDSYKPMKEQSKLIFASSDGNEFNSDILKEFGYKMIDGEIIDIKTGNIIKYDWSEVKQLI